jgi:hypothetical protein
VYVVIPDGAGGWYIGGYFSHVEGEPHRNLAHVLANGELAGWAPTVWGTTIQFGRDPIYPAVRALVLRGTTLYVGGRFSSVNGQTRNNLAALDTRTGDVLEWNPNVNGEVRCILAHGEDLYVGGYFTAVGDSARGRIAAFGTRSGALTPWKPEADQAVLGMAIRGRTMCVGGQFDHIGGQARNSLAALDIDTGKATAWDAHLGPPRRYVAHGTWVWPFVEGIAVHEGTVYVGGWFTEAGGQRRNSIAALDARSAGATEFDGGRDVAGYVNVLAVHGRTVYVGGLFGSIGGEERGNIAALDARTGTATPWNPRPAGPMGPRFWEGPPWDPRPDGLITALALKGNVVYVGGSFTNLYDWQARTGVAALDLKTGQVTPWNPTVERIGGRPDVTSLGLIGDSVYLVGWFDVVNGAQRSNIAAVDAMTGSLLPWNPGPLGGVGQNFTLAEYDNTVYVGGYFFGLGGKKCNYIAALDGTTAEVSDWNAHPDGTVNVVLPTGNAVYVGGSFHEIGGQPHPVLGAVDPVTGAGLPWNPRPTWLYPNGPVAYALAKNGDVVYAGGQFTRVGTESRNALAAVDAVSGEALPWAPEPNDLVLALATNGSTVWAGGRFDTIGAEARPYLAALDATTGVPLPWSAQADGEVCALVASGDTVCVGGSFRSMQGFPRGGVAVILPPGTIGAGGVGGTTQGPGGPLVVLWSSPNPLHGGGRIHFTLLEASSVTLAVFDLQGRRIQTLLSREWKPSGTHEVTLATRSWSPGVYFCRLEAGSRHTTRKLLVLH